MTVKRQKLSQNGRDLEVRAMRVDEGWRARVFDGDQPATDAIYSVSHENRIDASAHSTLGDLVPQLMQVAQEDVEQGRVSLR